MEQLDTRVDSYIAKTADFAKPILTHLRQLVHQAYPQIQETIKWGFPFFEYNGAVCHMAAFKHYCAFGFWKASTLTDPHGILNKDEEPSAGSIGRITSLVDLPDDEILIAYIQEVITLNQTRTKTPAKPKSKLDKSAITVPEEFIALLNENPAAQSHFNNFSASKQKEYAEWFTDAKTEATKQKRMQTALEWIAEGKSRNWKYQS